MPQTRRPKQAGSKALDRVQASIEGAELALKDLRGAVSRDTRDLLKDIDATLKTARRSLIRRRQRIVKDLEQIEQALVKGKPARRPARKRAAKASRTSASRSSKTARTTARSTGSTKRAAKKATKRPAKKAK